MARRILFALLIVAVPTVALAQNDVGLWLNTSHYKTTTQTDPTLPGATFKFKVDSRTGYGITFNHFSGPNLSEEFGYSQIKGEATAEVITSNPTVRASIDAGGFRANVVTGAFKWHFNPKSFIVPYIGAGAAYFTGGHADLKADAQSGTPAQRVKFDNKFGFLVCGGVNFAVTRGISIGADARYAPYKAQEKGTSSSEAVTLDPMTFSVGVRFHM